MACFQPIFFIVMLLQPLAITPQNQPAAQQPLKNTIKWQTASEVDNFGFNVYRGESQAGPFQKLNKKPIAGAGSTDGPRGYQYEDQTIEAGKAYFYYVESIALDGTREQFTPVFKAKPKFKN